MAWQNYRNSHALGITSELRHMERSLEHHQLDINTSVMYALQSEMVPNDTAVYCEPSKKWHQLTRSDPKYPQIQRFLQSSTQNSFLRQSQASLLPLSPTLSLSSTVIESSISRPIGFLHSRRSSRAEAGCSETSAGFTLLRRASCRAAMRIC